MDVEDYYSFHQLFCTYNLVDSEEFWGNDLLIECQVENTYEAHHELELDSNSVFIRETHSSLIRY